MYATPVQTRLLASIPREETGANASSTGLFPQAQLLNGKAHDESPGDSLLAQR